MAPCFVFEPTSSLSKQAYTFTALSLSPVIIAKIERDDKSIVPRGSTYLRDGDVVVLGGEAYFDATGEDLLEIKISETHKWAGKRVRDIKMDKHELIIMVETPSGEIIVPRGNTILNPGDRAVISKESNEIEDPE